MDHRIIPEEFFRRNPKIVACELLGKRLIRVIDGVKLEGMIVETEAYYGEEDPASRAYNGLKNYNSMMWDRPGRLFIYNVHKYWMLNVVAHDLNYAGGVLFRSVEPINGIKYMKKLRPVNNIVELTNGPGKLSIAFKITKELNGFFTSNPDSPLIIIDSTPISDYARSKRIGVKKDLTEELRFYVKENKFVSK
jgi:DNA-3-methyladenine glycosylase